TASMVVKGIALGCERAGCALIGGETAEMPGMYSPGEYDLAGFAVGVVEKSAVVDGSTIVPGDIVLGLASDGAHSNGYSLIRKIIAASGASLDERLGDARLADLILAPTRIYVKPVLELLRHVRVKGMAHITGGGIVENLPRVLAEQLTARLDSAAWTLPPLFRWLQTQGRVADEEMLRVFNCGIGMVLVVSENDAQRASDLLQAHGETVSRIGVIDHRRGDEPQTIVA
ncbi:MAG: phosphoribosylformylglycinamidine cyclo-ligase, partial [Pseudomonadota bacterium]